MQTEPRHRLSRSKVTLAVLAVCAMVVTLVAPAATAATTPAAGHQALSAAPAGNKAGKISLLKATTAPVTGTAADGTAFTGNFDLKRFQERRGVLYAVGTLTGTIDGKSYKHKVSLPVTNGSNESAPTTAAAAQAQQVGPTPTPGACSILTLNLGPLNLNILGLRVALDPVNLLIEAIPGAGNLLGNLLCGVAGLLDGGLLGGGLGSLLRNLLGNIADLLNGLLGAA
jgi:hypothetical protein